VQGGRLARDRLATALESIEYGGQFRHRHRRFGRIQHNQIGGFSDGRTLDVTIPAGAADGQTLRLKGQGSPGRAGAGDALIELRVRPHPIFRREGANLLMDVAVSLPDAVLGGKVQAPTPEGPVTLNVPKGSNSGSTLRLRRRGLSDGQGRRGDLLARLVVTLPDTPDETLEHFAEEWRRERPYVPRGRA